MMIVVRDKLSQSSESSTAAADTERARIFCTQNDYDRCKAAHGKENYVPNGVIYFLLFLAGKRGMW